MILAEVVDHVVLSSFIGILLTRERGVIGFLVYFAGEEGFAFGKTMALGGRVHLLVNFGGFQGERVAPLLPASE